jgi:hypothetical protein
MVDQGFAGLRLNTRVIFRDSVLLFCWRKFLFGLPSICQIFRPVFILIVCRTLSVERLVWIVTKLSSSCRVDGGLLLA